MKSSFALDIIKFYLKLCSSTILSLLIIIKINYILYISYHLFAFFIHKIMAYILQAKVTTKDGSVSYARDYDKIAFKLPVGNNAKKRKSNIHKLNITLKIFRIK